MPRISVLIPAHNAERYVAKAVRSVLADLPADSEVVVLDDASSDGTARAVEGIRDARLRLIRSEENLRQAGAMRALLAQTDSELVARLDADDLCLKGRFAHQVEEIEKGAEVSFGTLHQFGWGYLGRRSLGQPRLSVEGVRLGLLIASPLGQSGMMARRSAFGEDSYPDCATEDYATWLDLASRGVRIVLSDREVSAYRHHAGQITRSAPWKDQRWNDQAIVRSAYGRLSQAVLGITPLETHPIWGSWAEDTGADQRVVSAIDQRIDGFSGKERAYLRSLFERHSGRLSAVGAARALWEDVRSSRRS